MYIYIYTCHICGYVCIAFRVCVCKDESNQSKILRSLVASRLLIEPLCRCKDCKFIYSKVTMAHIARLFDAIKNKNSTMDSSSNSTLINIMWSARTNFSALFDVPFQRIPWNCKILTSHSQILFIQRRKLVPVPRERSHICRSLVIFFSNPNSKAHRTFALPFSSHVLYAFLRTSTSRFFY